MRSECIERGAVMAGKIVSLVQRSIHRLLCCAGACDFRFADRLQPPLDIKVVGRLMALRLCNMRFCSTNAMYYEATLMISELCDIMRAGVTLSYAEREKLTSNERQYVIQCNDCALSRRFELMALMTNCCHLLPFRLLQLCIQIKP
ncbi:hypothetical protein ACJJTC_016933 [Scirpophaga incertulas]